MKCMYCGNNIPFDKTNYRGPPYGICASCDWKRHQTIETEAIDMLMDPDYELGDDEI